MITKEKARAFLDELYELYRKYDISISHEDTHGAFILEDMKDINIEWIEQCFKYIEK